MGTSSWNSLYRGFQLFVVNKPLEARSKTGTQANAIQPNRVETCDYCNNIDKGLFGNKQCKMNFFDP